MEELIEKVLISEEQLQSKIRELAAEVSRDYADKEPVFVGVMKGVVMFFGDMVKRITVPCEMDFMWIKSYKGTTSTGTIEVIHDISSDIRGRHVIILEDVFDTGNSLSFVHRHLLSKEPASLKIVTLLDKPSRRNPNVTLKADYTGFVIENEFVVGYGMDLDEKFRNLPYIGVMKPEAYL